MAIIDMKRGNKNIVRAYKNNNIIFERGEPYIEPIGPELYETGGYIHIDDLELEYGYTYEIDFKAPDSYAYAGFNNHACIIGGSYSGGGTNNLLGLFLGFPYSSYASNGIGIRVNSRLRSGGFAPKVQAPYTPGERQVVSITYDDPSGDKVRTDGGFFLFAARDYSNGLEYYLPTASSYESEQTTHLYGLNGVSQFGRYFRITIKDSNDVILRDFYPRVVRGVKGVYDKITGKFYPCEDDTKFKIDKEA